MAFALGILTLFLTSAYSSTALFARVYPALFPGQTLGGSLRVSAIVPPLPGLSAVTKPNTQSAFNDNITLLIIGVDRRPYYREEDGYLTDVVMLATMDPIGKTVNFLSFPRDMWIDIHTDKFTYQDRINTSYGVGFRAGGGFDAGAKQVERDVLENFGVKVDYWLLLDFTGVQKLIDSIGGIDIDVPYELQVGDWFYSDDDINGRWISFPPGVQHLDGYHAVAFGRHRAYDNDFQRIKRQQLVVQTAIRTVFAQGLLEQNPFELWDIYSQTVRTDMSKTRMAGLIPLLRQTQARTRMFSVADAVNGTPTLQGHTTAGGAAVQLWNPENVQYWISQTFTKAAYADSNVEIQNGLGPRGTAQAEALAKYLAYSRGLPTVYLGPDQAEQPLTTITLYSDRKQLAQDIAEWLGVPEDRIIHSSRLPESTLPDVVIVTGADFKLPGT